MAREKLSPKEIDEGLAQLDGWTLENGKLHRELQFPNFIRAFGFMASVALVAEALEHHPEWSNVYNRVTIDLSSHDVGGISESDFELATKIDSLLA